MGESKTRVFCGNLACRHCAEAGLCPPIEVARSAELAAASEFSDFDLLVAELKRDHPEQYAEAQRWVREKFYNADGSIKDQPSAPQAREGGQPRVVLTAPERIYLQIGEDTDYLDQDFPHDVGEEITWCADSVLDVEVPYIRADLATPAQAMNQDAPAPDEGCICKGNWRNIVNKTRHLVGKRFRDSRGDEYTFFGPVDGQDDYYYGMSGQRLQLLSCVGSIEGHGFELIDSVAEAERAAAPVADGVPRR